MSSAKRHHDGIRVRLDRVQLISWAPAGRAPPKLSGYKIVSDWRVRSQTTTQTYDRMRWYQSTKDGTKIFWQYRRLKPWLKPWKISLVGDDKAGLTYEHVQHILKHCRFYRFLTVEIAIDFSSSLGVDKKFVRQHGVFGKSRRRTK